MNDADFPIALPEDLTQLPDRRHQRCAVTHSSVPRARLARSGITLSVAAVRAIDAPPYVTITYGPQSRMLAVAPSDRTGLRLHPATRRVNVNLISRLGIPEPKRGCSYHFDGQLAEGGTLLFGPLPGGAE